MKLKYLALTLFSLALAGCAIHQKVQTVEDIPGKEVCIVYNSAVKYSRFFDVYVQTLIDRGYDVKKIPEGSPTSTCPVTSTYTAQWRWDFAPYLAYAKIEVFINGKLAGNGEYNALVGPVNLGKFNKGGDARVKQLVRKLYPKPITGSEDQEDSTDDDGPDNSPASSPISSASSPIGTASPPANTASAVVK